MEIKSSLCVLRIIYCALSFAHCALCVVFVLVCCASHVVWEGTGDGGGKEGGREGGGVYFTCLASDGNSTQSLIILKHDLIGLLVSQSSLNLLAC